MMIGNLYTLAIASGTIVVVVGGVLVFGEDTCNALVDSNTDVSFSNCALFAWIKVGHVVFPSSSLLMAFLTLSSVSLSSLSPSLSAPPPRNINGGSSVSSLPSFIVLSLLFLSSIASSCRDCCLRPGRVTFSANLASYNKPGIDGASSFDISLTSARSGPHGDKTANRSYTASMISNAHAIQSLKYDNCHVTIIDDAIR